MLDSKKINTSIKLYPFFYAFSVDAIFFVPIDTLFFTLVKGLNASQISFITMIGLLVCILSQRILYSIIKKIGNVNSVRVGTFLLLLGSIIVTFGNSFLWMSIYKIITELALIFWNMSSILLKNDLLALKQSNQYFNIRNKAKIMYGVMTMITALLSGYLFTINKYIPLYISIGIYFFIFLLSFKFYEVKELEQEETEVKKQSKKVKLTTLLLFILLSNAIFYAIIKTGQSNSKLFLQYDFGKVLSVESVTWLITIIVFLSRIVRVIGNVVFGKLYLKIKDKISIVLAYLEFLTFFLLIIGHFINNFPLKVVVMSLGFFLLLAIRDSFQIYIEDLALKITNKEDQQKVIVSLEFHRQLLQLLLSGTFTLILVKYDLIVVEYILLFLSLIGVIINRQLYKKVVLLISSKKNYEHSCG